MQGKRRRIFLITGLSLCVFFALRMYFEWKHQTVIPPKRDASKSRIATAQRARVVLNTKLLDKNAARPHAAFKLQPWAINISQTRSKLFHEHNIVDRWSCVNLVKSAIQNRDRRDAIRNTWGAFKFVDGIRFETVFVLGATDNAKLQTEIEAENFKFGDLLQANISDTSRNISLKVLAAMYWVSQRIPSDWLYSSVDDDMVLHPPNFGHYIETLMESGGGSNIEKLPVICIYGYQTMGKPARNSKSKWYMSEEDYPEVYWPPYCRGGWYSMPVKTASELYEVSRTTPTLHLDDVWITGILRIRMFNQGNSKLKIGTVLKEEGIIGAPLSRRSDKELYYRQYEDDFSQIIVSHTWGNYGWFPTNVSAELRNLWRRWKPSVSERMKYFVA